MERENERSRMVVDGKPPTTVPGACWSWATKSATRGCCVPHGANQLGVHLNQLGVRLTRANADVVVQAILSGAQ